MSSRRLLALLFTVFLSAPAAAQISVQPAIAPGIGSVRAYPSLWHIKGEQGEVYLLGAVHVLPPEVRWRTQAISRVLSRSDVFVFEVPEDAAAMAELHTLIQAQGFLPPDQSLRAQLHPAALPDYDAAVTASGLPPPTLERERPWLAGIQLMFAQMAKLKYAAGNGVDSILMADAVRDHRQTRYFETIADQFTLLAPDDKNLEVQEFEAGLKDLRDLSAGIQPMIHAWSVGDQAKLDQLINGDLDEFPQARKLLLDDRNARWVPKIEAMLKEKHVFFITVGAGHLTGAKGVPALLRKAGYAVEGP
ncbi:MAG TPA: TraB/GumN family protein [Rhizomicrobium sp.]|nr:TraB/GumN family protein [Rhizomicrobium sp.]